jgi:hypothetical protein
MLIEAGVFAGNECLFQTRRRIFDRDRYAAFFAKNSNQAAVFGEHPERYLQLDIAQAFDVRQAPSVDQPGHADRSDPQQ